MWNKFFAEDVEHEKEEKSVRGVCFCGCLIMTCFGALGVLRNDI